MINRSFIFTCCTPCLREIFCIFVVLDTHKKMFEHVNSIYFNPLFFYCTFLCFCFNEYFTLQPGHKIGNKVTTVRISYMG